MIGNYATAACLLAALALAAAPGCHRASATDEDHLEHHVPHHKPQNLAGAIDQIDRRFELLGLADGTQNAERAAQLKELVDIVRWLPEIAGDSDLPEEQWNVVDRASEKLWPLLQEQLNHAERGEDFNLETLRSSVTAAVSQLREAAGKGPVEAASATSKHEGHDHD